MVMGWWVTIGVSSPSPGKAGPGAGIPPRPRPARMDSGAEAWLTRPCEPTGVAIHSANDSASSNKQAVMAVTGIILVGYVIAHLLGNLQIFSGNHEQINGYAAFLHNPNNMVALWAARSVLLLAVILHIVASVQLFSQNRAARPVAYI